MDAVLLVLAALAIGDFYTVQAIDGDDYRLRYRQPKNCDPDNCDYFIGIDTNRDNASYLDFYIVGRATGYVALGLTETPDMYTSDVLGCITDKEDQGISPLVMDTYNPSSPHLTNMLDPSELSSGGHPIDVMNHSTEFDGVHIRCNFSRLIKGVDPSPLDLLLNESLFLTLARGSKGGDLDAPNVSAMHMTFHDIATPITSKKKYNIAEDHGEIGVYTTKEKLLVAHGMLMLVAWLLLSPIAIFFAAWMKPALPNGQWFQVHRAFNLAALVVAVAGFVVVFVAYRDESQPGLIALGSSNTIGTTHFVLGVVIMTLQFVNPIISLCRCKPDDKYRWVFIVVHSLIIGYGAMILAFTNIGLGLSIYSQVHTTFGDLTLLWIYLAAAIFSILLSFVLFILFSGEALILRAEAWVVAPTLVKLLLPWIPGSYTRLGNSTARAGDLRQSHNSYQSTDVSTSPLPAANRKPSRDAPCRWVALIVFLVVEVPVVITLIVLMVLKENLQL